MATCYRHPDRETGVSCSNCGKPICPDCMTPTPVGMRCPECSRDRTPVRTMANIHGDPVLTYVLIGHQRAAVLRLAQQPDRVLRPRAGGRAGRRRGSLAAADRRLPARPGRLRLHPHRLQHVPALHPRAAAGAEPRQVALRRHLLRLGVHGRVRRDPALEPEQLHRRRLGRGVRADGGGRRLPARPRRRSDGLRARPDDPHQPRLPVPVPRAQRLDRRPHGRADRRRARGLRRREAERAALLAGAARARLRRHRR